MIQSLMLTFEILKRSWNLFYCYRLNNELVLITKVLCNFRYLNSDLRLFSNHCSLENLPLDDQTIEIFQALKYNNCKGSNVSTTHVHCKELGLQSIENVWNLITCEVELHTDLASPHRITIRWIFSTSLSLTKSMKQEILPKAFFSVRSEQLKKI